MKKIAPIAVALLLLAGMTSCKKDYTCKCTITTNGVSVSGTSSSFKETKKKAKETCDKGDATTTVSGFTSKTDCEIQ